LLIANHAVKAVPIGSSLLPELKHEANMYDKLTKLQNLGFLPRVKATGDLFMGSYYGFAMEVLGPNLGSFLPESRLVFKEQAVQCLSALHEEGYLHGDIRLENFVTAPGGRVVVIDLGFAQAIANVEDQHAEMEQLLALLDR
jgi:serine/threonine protein kinase